MHSVKSLIVLSGLFFVCCGPIEIMSAGDALGRELQFKGEFSTADFCGNGQKFAFVSERGNLSVVDLGTLTVHSHAHRPADLCTSLRFSTDSKKLYMLVSRENDDETSVSLRSTTFPEMEQLWDDIDVSTDGSSVQFSFIQLSHENRLLYLVGGKRDIGLSQIGHGEIQVFRQETGARILQERGHSTDISSCCGVGKNSLLTAAADGQVLFWERLSGGRKVLFENDSAQCGAVSCSYKHKLLAAAVVDDVVGTTLYTWDSETFALRLARSFPDGDCPLIAFHPTRPYVVVSTSSYEGVQNGRVFVLSLKDGAISKELTLNYPVRFIEWSPNGESLVLVYQRITLEERETTPGTIRIFSVGDLLPRQ